ncbi:MAG: AAA family ATPase [Bacteroidaceae bacterium]|nr:AAA family ATPase [Bacteroidaceae bacterium]
MEKFAELSIQNFRAIKSADITLNGITVVSGINGCGKSTMSKLLYYIFRNANSFEEIVGDYIKQSIEPYITAMNTVLRIAMQYSTSLNYRRFMMLREGFDKISSDRISKNVDYLHSLKANILEILAGEKNIKPHISERESFILRSALGIKVKDDVDLSMTVETIVGKIIEKLERYNQLVIERPYHLFASRMEDFFESDALKNVSLREYESLVYGHGLKNVPELHYIKKVAYIDTPMVIGLPISSQQPMYWKEINELAKNPPRKGYKLSINKLIKQNIMNGDASYDDDYFAGGFKYNRVDGKVFDLTECATGIKSFSIMQLLLKNLFLGANTLMILDEPETHLHPQWIVEYANLIVMLHKRLGVKFFITSHSTDMVSAIRYISEKEKCLNNVSFYLAEQVGTESYSYKYLKDDIEPIFESFNKSYDKLDEYAR